MRYILTLLVIFWWINFSLGQKFQSFEGAIFYDVYLLNTKDNSLVKVNYLTLRIKDSLVRIDTYSEHFGGETTIRNINQHKSYTLLKNKEAFYAIRNKEMKDTTKAKVYKKIKGNEKLDGFRIKKATLFSTDGIKDTLAYFPSISPAYLGIKKGIKGLPAVYFVKVNTYTKYLYKAFKIESQSLDDKIFQIPTLFKIITIEDFIQLQQDNKE